MTHKAMARVNALTLGGTGPRSLPAMEAHGKRLDRSSRDRAVSRRRPIVFGSLDLRDAYDRHVDGARQNAALGKPVLHMIMKFPDACLTTGADTPAPYRGLSERDRKKLMLSQAVEFANRCYGGNAVFAGRVDRDEAGELNVDVFMCPRYVKRTKTGKESDWISTTKHGKELAQKHRAAIVQRMPKGEADLSNPRAIGIAIQEELAAFHREVNGIEVVREMKTGRKPDWRAIEDWKASEDAVKAADDAEARRALAEAEAAAQATIAAGAARLAREAEARRMAEEEKAEEAERQRAAAEALAAEEAVRRQRAEADARAAQQRRVEAENAAGDAHRKADQERLAALAAIEVRKKADEDIKAARDAAAARFRAQGAAFESLARQFEAGELSWTSDGRIRAADVETLKAGMPTIGPALQAMVSLHEEVAGMRKEAAEDRAAAAAERKAAAEDRVMISEALQEIRQHQAFFKSVRQRLSDGMKRLADWLKRPDLSGPARSAGEKLNGDLDDLMREEIEAGTVIGRLLSQAQDKGLSPEKPREEPDGLGLDR